MFDNKLGACQALELQVNYSFSIATKSFANSMHLQTTGILIINVELEFLTLQ